MFLTKDLIHYDMLVIWTMYFCFLHLKFRFYAILHTDERQSLHVGPGKCHPTTAPLKYVTSIERWIGW